MEKPIIVLTTDDLISLGYDLSNLSEAQEAKIFEQIEDAVNDSDCIMQDVWDICSEILNVNNVPKGKK